MTKFDWLATESAPNSFPMKIISGDFIAPDGSSRYIPNNKEIHHGWGKSISTHVGGPDLKSLPNRMEIKFFSFTENVFYQGEFDLPYDTIVRLFNEGYYSPKKRRHTTYHKITAGVAPGGSVAVWLLGTNKRTEVFYGKAKKTDDIPWSKVTGSTHTTRETYIHMSLMDAISIEKINEIKKNGIPFELWDSYRVHYPWQPVIVADQPPAFVNAIFYFNGEEDYLRYPLDEASASALRPIPQRIFYIWDDPEGKTSRLWFNFDEVEMFAVFKKLSPDGKTSLKLEFHTRKIDGVRKYAVQLSNEKEVVVLEKMYMGKARR